MLYYGWCGVAGPKKIRLVQTKNHDTDVRPVAGKRTAQGR